MKKKIILLLALTFIGVKSWGSIEPLEVPSSSSFQRITALYKITSEDFDQAFKKIQLDIPLSSKEVLSHRQQKLKVVTTAFIEATPRAFSIHISSLPPELLSLTFEFLNARDRLNASRVCREWSGLAKDPALWKDTWVRPANTLKGRPSWVSKIDISKMYGKTSLKNIISSLKEEEYPPITGLDLGNKIFSLNELSDLRKFPNLTTLYLTLGAANFEREEKYILDKLPILRKSKFKKLPELVRHRDYQHRTTKKVKDLPG